MSSLPSRTIIGFGFSLLIFITLTACAQPSPIISPSPSVTNTVIPSATLSIPTPIPERRHAPPYRTLTICLAAEPDTLFIYGSNMLTAFQVQQAIYDGPIDSTGFSYQPVILEKLPSLTDGDAVVNNVAVRAGDIVVADDGNPTTLTATSGTTEVTKVRPAGCRSTDCAVMYDGTNVTEMDQMVVTFRLLPVIWSDGTPLTAGDSVYSFQLSGSPDVPNANRYTWDRTAKYEATDDVTIIWTGLPGYFDSLYNTNFWQPLPQHIMGQYAAADLMTQFDAQKLWLGWGPYIIDEWVRGEQIMAHKNPNYFRVSEGLPHFDQLVFRFLPGDEDTTLAGLLSGECDLIDREAGQYISLEKLLELDNNGQLNALISTSTTWEHLDFNIQPAESIINSGAFAGWDQDGNGQGPFGDVRLRQAIAMCLDRQAVVDTVLLGQSPVLDTYLPPNHPLFNPQATHWPYDPMAANTLLDDIGWLDTDGDPATPRLASGVIGVPDGTPLTMNYETTDAPIRQQITQILAQSLGGCGIQVNIALHSANDWFAAGPDGKLYGRLYDLGEFAWLTGVIPPCDLFLSSQIPSDANTWSGQNSPGFNDPAYDVACNLQFQSLPGEAAYMQGALEAQRIFAEQLPVIPLFLRIKTAAARADMCGYWLDPTSQSDFWNIEVFDYGEGCR